MRLVGVKPPRCDTFTFDRPGRRGAPVGPGPARSRFWAAWGSLGLSGGAGSLTNCSSSAQDISLVYYSQLGPSLPALLAPL